MLGDSEATATLATKDLAAAREFYQGTLGLKVVKEDEGGIAFEAGKGSHVFVYPSQFAGSNQATALAFMNDGVEGIAEALKNKGVQMEHYDSLPGVKLEGDIHIMGDLKAIWFKDPDGNILNVVNMMS